MSKRLNSGWKGLEEHRRRAYTSGIIPRKLEASEGKTLIINDLIGSGYDEFWNFRGRYRFLKGGRGSKKSYTMAYWVIINMMKYPQANTLVIRQVEKSHRTSTFSLIKKLIWSMGLQDYWSVNTNTMTITLRSTGQEIRFAGLDNPLKLTSMDVPVGILCWVWFEEVYEVRNREDFDIIDESIRGAVPLDSGLFKQITCTFNPWRPFWAKDGFFDRCDPSLPTYDAEFAKNCLCLTTTHWCNEWLDASDHERYESLKTTNPRRYQVAALGDWGVPGDLIYENWDRLDVKRTELRKIRLRYPHGIMVCGLDFGFEHNTALVAMFVDKKSRQMWVYDEIVLKHATNREIGERLGASGYNRELVIADSADPKAIEELRLHHGFHRIFGARKGPDSVEFGIQYCRQYTIHVFRDCINTLTEIGMYCYAPDLVTGELTDRPLKENDDCMDAMRYGMSYIEKSGGVVLSSDYIRDKY